MNRITSKNICFILFVLILFKYGFASDSYDKAIKMIHCEDKPQEVMALFEQAIDEGDERGYVWKGLLLEAKKSYKDMLLFYNTAADAGSILAMFQLVDYYTNTDTSQAPSEIPKLKRTFLKLKPSPYNLKWYVDSLVLFLQNKEYSQWSGDEYCSSVLNYLEYEYLNPKYADVFCGVAIEASCVSKDDPRYQKYLIRSFNAGIPSSVYYMGDLKLKQLCDNKGLSVNEFIEGLRYLRNDYFMRAGNLGYENALPMCNKINEAIRTLEEKRDSNSNSVVGLLKSITDFTEENKGIILGTAAVLAGANILKNTMESDPEIDDSTKSQHQTSANDYREYIVHYEVHAPRTKSRYTPRIIFYKNGDRSAFWSSNSEIANLSDDRNTGSTTLTAGRWEVVLRYDSEEESIGGLSVGEGLPNTFIYIE